MSAPNGSAKREDNALYRHYDSTGRLLYIGITNDPGRRWEQHCDKAWWHHVDTTRIERFPDRKSVESAERAAIIAERPWWNVVHNDAMDDYKARCVNAWIGYTERLSQSWVGDDLSSDPDDEHAARIYKRVHSTAVGCMIRRIDWVKPVQFAISKVGDSHTWAADFVVRDIESLITRCANLGVHHEDALYAALKDRTVWMRTGPKIAYLRGIDSVIDAWSNWNESEKYAIARDIYVRSLLCGRPTAARLRTLPDAVDYALGLGCSGDEIVEAGASLLAGGMRVNQSTLQKQLQGSSKAATRQEPTGDVAVRLSALLARRINESAKLDGIPVREKVASPRWITIMESLLEESGATSSEVTRMIEWCYRDDFWRRNILGVDQFRQQFDKIRLLAKRPSISETYAMVAGASNAVVGQGLGSH